MKKNTLRFLEGMAFALPFLLIFSVDAFAAGRSLDQAAGNAVSVATNVGKVISILGILISGIVFNIPGMADAARKIFAGSLMGSACAFGGPALIRAIQTIF